MQFELNEDQALLKTSTREMLESESPIAEIPGRHGGRTAEGYSKKLYAELGELGYPGLLLTRRTAAWAPSPSRRAGRDGSGGVPRSVPRPHRCGADPGVPAASAAAGMRRARRRPARRSSSSPATRTAAAPIRGDVATRFRGGRVVGTKIFVPFGAQADALLVETTPGLVLVERPGAGWNATPLQTFDHAQRFATIHLDDPGTLVADRARAPSPARDAIAARRPRCGRRAASADGTRARDRGRLHDASVEAFGVPIGSFQALQHRCADMLIQTESTPLGGVPRRLGRGERTGRRRLPHVRRQGLGGTGGAQVCGQAIQLLGGVGFTWEYDPHIYLKRVKTLEAFHGTAGWHTENALQRSAVLPD